MNLVKVFPAPQPTQAFFCAHCAAPHWTSRGDPNVYVDLDAPAFSDYWCANAALQAVKEAAPHEEQITADEERFNSAC